MPKVSEFLFGGKDKVKKASVLDKDQEELLALIKQGLTSGEGPFSDIFGKFNEQEFEQGVTQPALKNFQENILPQLQEKFIAGNQVLGSGMRNAQLKAGTDLQSKLAELMYGAQQQQKQNRAGGIQQALGTKAFENIYQQGKEGVVPGVLKGAATGFGTAVGNAIPGVAQAGAANTVVNSAKQAVVG